MKITRFEHATMVLEKDGKALVIDLSDFAPSFVMPDNVSAVVITHDHGDHFSQDKVNEVLAAFPEAVLCAPATVLSEVAASHSIEAAGGQSHTVGGFTLEFAGGRHALIVDDQPDTANVGVLVDGTFYYPGDSFDLPPQQPRILALPVSGPWLKTGESVGFLREVKPDIAFPTHDSFLSEDGLNVTDQMLARHSEAAGCTYHPLKPGESIEIEESPRG